MLRAQLEVPQDQARTAATLAVSEFLALEEITKIKGSNYNEGVHDFTHTVPTERPDWDLSFLGAQLSAMVAKWRALVPQSCETYVPLFGEPPVNPPPLEDYLEKIIEADPMVNLEEDDDDLERINDPKGALDP